MLACAYISVQNANTIFTLYMNPSTNSPLSMQTNSLHSLPTSFAAYTGCTYPSLSVLKSTPTILWSTIYLFRFQISELFSHTLMLENSSLLTSTKLPQHSPLNLTLKLSFAMKLSCKFTTLNNILLFSVLPDFLILTRVLNCKLWKSAGFFILFIEPRELGSKTRAPRYTDNTDNKIMI